MSTTPEVNERTINPTDYYSHEFHAGAHVLSGNLKQPIEQDIERHAPVSLKDPRGGHKVRLIENISIEGLITFKRGHTRVSGSKSQKHESWVTLSTSVLEGLNVFEVLTADRIVTQVSTEHPFIHGHVPRVTFLGSKFEGLKICGIPIDVTLNLKVCGDPPSGDESYLTKKDTLLAETLRQATKIRDCGFLPEAMWKIYDDRVKDIETLVKGGAGNKITCSLVKSINGIDKVKQQIPGVEVIENVLVIRDFGAVSLGEVEVGVEPGNSSKADQRREKRSNNGNPAANGKSNYFEVTMLNMELGCVGAGSVKAGQSKTNGQTSP